MDHLSPDSPCAPVPVLILVDDDTSYRSALAAILRDDGHAVLEYGSPTSVPPFADLPAGALLVTDYDMPEQTGIALADKFRSARPGGGGILLSGHTFVSLEPAIDARPWLRFVSKAVDYDVLHAAIHAQAAATGCGATATAL